MTPKDTDLVEARLQQRESFVVLHSDSTVASPRMLDSIDFNENGSPWLFLFLARPEDVDQIVTTYVPNQNHWTIDSLRSPVIELTRSFFDSQTLRRGRVYYVDGFYGSDQTWTEKDATFKKWAKSIFSTMKRCLRRRGSDYIGDDALSWLESSGGKLIE